MTRLAALLAILLLASGCALGGGNTVPRGSVTYHGAVRHWVTVHPGLTRLFSPGVVAAPLTIACPGDAAGRGIKQVIRAPLKPGFGGVYGDSMRGHSLRVDVSPDGSLSITCS